MPDEHESNHNSATQLLYRIRLAGHLSTTWENEFLNMTSTRTDKGETVLTGFIVDQAALHGILKRIRDMGIPLISVERLDPDDIPKEGRK